MKLLKYTTYHLGLLLLFINIIYAKNDNNNDINNLNDADNGEDKYYLIFINNTHGELKLYSNPKNQKRQDSQIFIESLIDEIHEIIIDNKDTYQNPEKLEEIEKENSKLNKRNNENSFSFTSDSNLVYPISSVNDRVVLLSFLSETVVDKINSLNNVINCIPNSKSIFSVNHYYNKDDILTETHWKDLSVQENADFHLSLLSQGEFQHSLVSKYDNNYYYPDSAGEGVDIVILDTSFHFDYSEFSNRENRTVECAANIENGIAVLDDIDHYCGISDIYHGEIVADVAGGLKHGVAKKANIYGVSIPRDTGGINTADILGGLQFINEQLIRPHKTVVNLSLGGFYYNDDEYFMQIYNVIQSIITKGGVVVSAAGNWSKMLGGGPYGYFLPCEIPNVICVGGINNKSKNNIDLVYERAFDSNFGYGVNIYAPYYVKSEVYIYSNNTVQEIEEEGTSFSSPLVAGIIATIMSEDLNIKYDPNIIYKRLYGYGSTELIPLNFGNSEGINANNGKHIVYSEDEKYFGCGVYAGNLPCKNNDNDNSITKNDTIIDNDYN